MIEPTCEERFDVLRRHVTNFWYLEQSILFLSNKDLQLQMFQLVQQGMASHLQVFCNDLEAHVNALTLYASERKEPFLVDLCETK